MEWNILWITICGAIALVGAMDVAFQIYHMTLADATARGLKHPRFWALFAVNGNNSSGLLMYLMGRRNYPLNKGTQEVVKEIDRRKKAAGVGLIFLAIGAMGLIMAILL